MEEEGRGREEWEGPAPKYFGLDGWILERILS